MSKRLLSLCLVAVLAVMSTSAWALDKQNGAYQIGTAEDLKAFAELVNGGEIHAYAQLTADIDYGTEQTQIGCDANKFAGAFDGMGHTIKVNFFSDEDGSGALFRNLNNSAIVQNLRVIGNITTTAKYSAGIAAWAEGATIRNCMVDITIESGLGGDATHAGIAAVVNQGFFATNCLSKVVINGATTENCGGLVGWASARTNVQNCLVINEGTFKQNNNSATIGRNGGQLKNFEVAKYVEFRSGANYGSRQDGACYNNYALNDWGGDEGNVTYITTEDLKNGKVCYMLNNDQTDIQWTQTIGEDDYPMPKVFGKGSQVYASVATNCHGLVEVAEGEEAPQVTYSNTATAATAAAHTWENGVCTTCGFFNDNHLERDLADGCILVRTADDMHWCEIKNQVSNGARFSIKQMAPIEISALGKGYTIFNNGNWFDGNYNGQGYDLTIHIADVTGENAALFPQASGTLENICLHGDIAAQNKFSASFVGTSRRGTLMIRNVYSDATISTTMTGDVSCGGILGKADSDFKLANAVFAGKVVGVEGTTNVGGIIGWCGSRCEATNVAMIGSIENCGDDTHSISRSPGMFTPTNCWCTPNSGAPKYDEMVPMYDDGEVESGSLAFKLNGNQNGGESFFQTLGTDNAPYPFVTGGHQKVYANPTGGFRCDGTPLGDIEYSNTASSATIPDHSYADNGFCSVCGDVNPNFLTPAEDGWFELANATELTWWSHYAAKVNLGACARLTDDIDMLGVDNYAVIGGEFKPFYGSVDGQFHVISNLKINVPTQKGVGFIGVMNSIPTKEQAKDTDRDANPAFIRNLTLDESCSVTAQGYVGGILGMTSSWPGRVEVKNCVVRCSVTAVDAANAGGIHGCCMGSTCAIVVDNCGVTSTVTGPKENGVISGWMGSHGTLTNCWSISEVYEGDNLVSNFVRATPKSENNWWIKGQDGIVTNTFNLDIVSTGELAWRLNRSQFKEPVWYQRVGDDAVPYLDSERGVVAYICGEYYSIYDDASLMEAVDAAKAGNDELTKAVAYQGTRDELADKLEALDACADYIDLAIALDTINVYVGKVNASIKAYEAYKTICENTIAYLETHQDFEGEDRDNLTDYLNEYLDPSEENPYGSYQYVWENMQVTDEELAKEGERVNQWLLDAIVSGYIPGTEVTNLMVNADFLQGTEGWNNTSGVGVLQTEIGGKKLAGAERWQGSISNMYQTIEGLKPGYYKVEITGAVRPYNDRYGLNYIGTFDINGVTNYFMADIEDPISVDDAIDGVNCNLTGGVNDLAIYEDGVSTSNEEGGDPIGYVMHGQLSVACVINADTRYKNYVMGYVGEDGKLTFTINKENSGNNNDWIGFGNIRLTYCGEAETDATAAALDDVLASQGARANTILESYLPSYDDFKKAPSFPNELRQALAEALNEVDAAETNEAKIALVEKFSDIFKDIREAKKAYKNVYGISLALFSTGDRMGYDISEEEWNELTNYADHVSGEYFVGTYTAEQAENLTMFKENEVAKLYVPEFVGDTLQIASIKQMAFFSAYLREANKWAKAVLVDDIKGFTESMMINDFDGVLDGKFHSIEMNLVKEDGSENAGIFHNLNGTVKNLIVLGNITTNGKYAAGVAAHGWGSARIENVTSSVHIASSIADDGTHAGILGVCDAAGVIISNCVFDGIMEGEQTWSCGGIVGWCGNSVTVENCLQIASINVDVTKGDSHTWGRKPDNLTLKNSYYLTPFGTTAGTLTTKEKLASGETCYALNAGNSENPAWFQTLGTDSVPSLIPGSVVYKYGDLFINEKPNFQLNAFAYDVKGGTDANEVSVVYTLNAEAESVDVIFKNGDEVVATVPGDTQKGKHVVAISNSELGCANGTSLTFEVKVNGIGSPEVKKLGDSYKVWSPYGIACNNVPSSPGFGQTYLVETDPDEGVGYDNGAYTGYISDVNHSALYAFDADFQQILNANGEAGFTGGLDIKLGLYANPGYKYDLKSVRVSKDGRIFIGRGNGTTNSPIVEANAADLNADFTPVFTGGQLDETTGIVWAGDQEQARMVTSFDVEGAGADLKLWVLGNQYSDGGFNYTDYACHTYNLGTASAWTGAASSVFTPLTGQYTIASKPVNVVSDQKGGLWYVQYRSTPSEAQPALKHYNADGVEDYSDIKTPLAKGAMAISDDGETFALPTAANKVTIYTTDYAPNPLGKIFLNSLGTFSIEEASVSAMAFDYAGNLYVASDATETVSRYTVPRENKTVVTPGQKTLVVGSNDLIDAIESVDSNTTGSQKIFNLQGVQLNKAQKGVNIINGRKVMVK